MMYTCKTCTAQSWGPFTGGQCDTCWEAKQPLKLNIVTCGYCGKLFGHEIPVDELTCPYCKVTDDPSAFPDLWCEEGRNSIINII
jgi:hypothetical protein